MAVTAPTIKVSPTTATARVGQSKTFSASTTGIEAPATVVWKVASTAASSNGDLGTVTSKGVYTAPASVPTPNTVLVEAMDSANSGIVASATVTIDSPLPSFSSLTPSTINTGLAYSLDIKGSGFLASTQVMFNGQAVPSQFVSSGEITVAGTSSAAAGTKITVTLVNPDPGGATSSPRTLTVEPPVQVQVTPDKRTVRCGGTLTFSAKVSNTADKVVQWQVNGQNGGAADVGTIDSNGVYTAPSVLPASTSLTITAISHADPTVSASVGLTLENAIAVLTSVNPNPIAPGAVSLTLTGSGFAQGATVVVAGTTLTPTSVTTTQITATGNITMPLGRIAAVKVVNPGAGGEASNAIAVPVRVANEQMAYKDAVRFLEMASWGATPSAVANLQSMGRDAWLAAQFQTPASVWPDPNSENEGVSRLQDAFFTIAMTGPDQLRQRVAFGLGSILVASAIKDTKFEAMVSYQRLLGNDAFGTFRALLGDITLNPAMGWFLDMVNNDKANPTKGTAANENYAREVMQLFTVGEVQLDGTGVPLSGNPPEYSQATVTDMAKVFTGWTYAPAPGFASHWKNDPYFFAPMVAFEDHHDTTAKNISLPSPCAIAAGGTAELDLNQALDCLTGQANVAPFISYRLIQRLVKSGPSPAYVGRVASVFTNSGGDLKQVITAILTDTEAMTEGSGKLREPVLYTTHLLSALGATVNQAATGLRGQTTNMGQTVLTEPSVFSYFAPGFHVAIPGVTPSPVAPEFQILNAETAFARINFAWQAAANQLSKNITVDLTNLEDLSSDPTQLTEAMNQAFYRGEITSGEQAAIMAAIAAGSNPLAKARNAVYAGAAAPQFQVEQ